MGTQSRGLITSGMQLIFFAGKKLKNGEGGFLGEADLVNTLLS